MTTNGVSPEGKGKAPSSRKSWPNLAIWAGIFAIGISLLWAGMTWLQSRSDAGREWDSLFLPCCYGPGTLLAALLAVLGIVTAKKEKSTAGFAVSLSALILTVLLFVVSITLLPPNL